uniref:Uncharacterized protein n=1 Tax=Arundo donax TaxID=35708 RepID=A0A0A9ES11_ARUDO
MIQDQKKKIPLLDDTLISPFHPFLLSIVFSYRQVLLVSFIQFTD